MVQREVRRDTGVEKPVDEPVVEVDARLVERAPAVRLHPRPGHREAVGAETELPHRREVLGPAVVVVGGHVTGVAVQRTAGGVAERVPDRLPAAVLGGGPFDLVGSGGCPPEERRGQVRELGKGLLLRHG